MNTTRTTGLALAAGLALSQAPLQAQAQSLTLYGAIGLDVVSASNVYDGTRSGSVVKVEDNAIVNSRFGLKGSEDLGGGLKALFNLESSIAPDTGGARSTFWNRGAWLGLSGSMGTLKLGQQWNVADDYLCGYFVCGYYAPFLMSGFYALSDYYSNAIKYTSPNMGGFEGALYHSVGERAGDSSAGSKSQAALNYSAGAFGLGLTTFSEKDPKGGPSNTMHAVGASYDLGAAKLRAGLAYAEVKYSYNGTTDTSDYSSGFKARLLDLGVDVPISAKLSTSLDYVKKDVKDSDNDTWFVRARASYALSKRTALNFNLIRSSNDGTADFAFVTQGRGFSGEAGQSQTLVTAGITHAF